LQPSIVPRHSVLKQAMLTMIRTDPDHGLDVHLLKPARLDVLPEQPDVVCADDGQMAEQLYLEYPFRKFHPIIRWLPTKLAAWIGENYGQELQIPPKRDVEWTAGELNAILENNLVPSHGGKGQLRTFGCIQ
jgi:hypothetical protein